MRHRRPNLRPAFTLVEMVVSSVVLAVIMGALGSLFVLLARAFPGAGHPAERTASLAAAVDELAADVALARSLDAGSATALRFTVPDRDGDGLAETIAYRWSGVDGEPLVKTVNSLLPTTVVPSVRSLTFAYGLRELPTHPNFASGPVVIAGLDTGATALRDISATSGHSQFFRPALPAGAGGWSVSRVLLRLEPDATRDGVARVQLRTATAAGLPTATVLAEALVEESAMLPVGEFTAIDLAATGLAASDGLCIVLLRSSGAGAGRVAVRSTGATAPAPMTYAASTDGAAWTAEPAAVIPFYVVGSVSAGTPTLRSLERVDLSIRAGAPAAAADVSIRLLNLPQIP